MATNNTSNEPTAAVGKVLQGQGVGTASNFSTATYPSTAGTSGKVLISDGTNIISSTPTFPNASATSGKFIRSDGTNWIASTPTLPTSAGTSGKVLQSDGTNYVESTPTYPSTSGNSGKVLISDGTNNIYSTPTFPNSATGTGTLLRSDGTNWVATTSTYPNTNAVSTLLYASSTNVMSALATANNGTLVTSSTGVPSILAGPGTTGNILQSNAAAAPSFSTTTYPSTAGTSGKVLISDGTNIISSTPTFPNASATSGKFIRSDGTNWIASTPTLPTSAGTSGKHLQSDGTNYVETTATYPSTATGTGTILRADGTNWVASTSTYPNTNAVNTLLYASSANVMAALATANSGVLTTSSGGVPSIDTTNFSVLSTGVQMKGNNTNTAPPAGFIGEQIRSAIASGSAVSLTTATPTNITSISLTAGIWDVTGVVLFTASTGTMTFCQASINTTSATLGTSGDNNIFGLPPATGVNQSSVVVPPYRLTLSTTTTTYLVAQANSTGNSTGYGRISATRVG